MKLKIVFLMLISLLATVIIGCEPKQKQISSTGAQQITFHYQIPLTADGLSAEQDIISRRIQVTTDPTKVLWIHLIALDGKIIRRMPVVTKVTSSGKRLEPRRASGYSENSAYYPSAGNGYSTDEFIQADGTYGESDPYIYWFDPLGRYHQWGTAGGLGYLLTDYPIDLQNPINEITGMYNMSALAYEWQEQQEARLRKEVNKK